jgi:hypothetical protein
MVNSPIEDWRRSAAEYLEWWSDVDRQLVRDFSGGVTCALLADLCSPKKYKVARTVPGHGPEKYQALAEMLNSLRHAEMTRQTVPGIIEQACSDMQEEYGKSLPSAISKAVWMMKGHPVVIYDSLAWEGLRRSGLAPGYEGYRTFFNAWFTFFDKSETQKRLDDAVASLPGLSKIDDAELKELTASGRLRNRIVDFWLWNRGDSRARLSPHVFCQTEPLRRS